MVFQGKVMGGVVVLENAAPPEGTRVRVEVVDDQPQGSLSGTLRKYVGKVDDLPPDMAENHDHYIHGGPKR